MVWALSDEAERTDEADSFSEEPDRAGHIEVVPVDASILDSKTEVIIERLADLSDPELVALQRAEENGKARKGVMQAMADELERRADADPVVDE